jgi:HK97 family phage prohead protease
MLLTPARFPNGVETRAALTLRAVSGRKLAGYAAIFSLETRIGDFRERIRPGAFAASLAAAHDILALVDHDPSRLLARTASKTLRLGEDSRGLHFELDVPETSLGHDVLALAERGDIGGMSFGFRVREEDWQGDRRELRAVDLVEVSVVHAYPAYSQTEVQARASARAINRRRIAEAL